jgi:hypothetical protein
MLGIVSALQTGPLGSKSPSMQLVNHQGQSSMVNNISGGHYVVTGDLPNSTMANNNITAKQGT